MAEASVRRVALVTWRPAEPSDAGAIVDLQDACFEVDDTYREVESEILERFDDPDTDASLDSRLGLDAEGNVVASAWSYVPGSAATKWRAFGDIHVHPDWRAALWGPVLDWWEQRSRARLAGLDESLPKRLWLGAYEQERAWIDTLVDRGYGIERYYDELIRDLRPGVPRLEPPLGISFVAAEEAGPGHEVGVHNESFRDHWGSQPFTQERWDHFKNDFYLPDASYVAYDGDRPVGHIMCAAYPHDFEDRGFTHAWIESLGVIRTHRKRGIASALIAASCRDFAGSGMEFAVLGVDSENPSGAYGLYEGLDFVPHRRTLTLVKPG